VLIIRTALLVWLGIGLPYWLYQLYAVVRSIRATPRLKDVDPPEPKTWPRVSAVLTARNEAGTMEPGIRTRIADDYPELEIVVVDDRSEDQTGAIADRLASEDPRVKAVHVKELAEDWLGKQNAMQHGVEAATGEWLLFSDSDVLFEPGTLRKAVAYCEHRQRDHLAVMPELLPGSFVLDTVLAVFVRTLTVAGRLWQVEDRNSKAALGSGSFNLVRRSALDRTPGFAAIRMNQGDDVALGVLLKRHGARQSVAQGTGMVKVLFYPSLKAAAIGSERPVFTDLGNFSLARLLLTGVALLAMELSPFAGFLPARIPWLAWFAAGFSLLAFSTSFVTARWWHRPFLPSFCYPLGSLLHDWFIIRAGVLGWRRGGVYWRGTFYRTELLRKYKKHSLKVL
jgi:glycosyltransferase involved in cell wall biosynthesis